MPQLDTQLHLDMYRGGLRRRSFLGRLKGVWKALLGTNDVYGLEWGDPETLAPLMYVRDHFLKPYVSPNATIVEIGGGGGRWTRYMLAAHRSTPSTITRKSSTCSKPTFPNPTSNSSRITATIFPVSLRSLWTSCSRSARSYTLS